MATESGAPLVVRLARRRLLQRLKSLTLIGFDAILGSGPKRPLAKAASGALRISYPHRASSGPQHLRQQRIG
jgi:hypothetical protein